MKVIRAERIGNSGTYINFCMTCIETCYFGTPQ